MTDRPASPSPSCESIASGQSHKLPLNFKDMEPLDHKRSESSSMMSLCTETSTSTSWTKYEDDISVASIPSAADSGVFVKTGQSREITMKLYRYEHRTVSRYAEAGNVACDLCQERKLKAYKSCMTCLASFCERHVMDHYKIPALQRHKLVEVTKNLSIILENAQEKKIIKEMQKKNQTLMQESLALKDENKALKKENSALKEENSDLEEENSDLEEEKSALKEENSDLEEEKSALKKENSTLKKVNSALKKENSALKEENSDLEEENSALEEEKSALKKENSTLKKENSTLKKENSALKEENSALKEENSDLKEENSDLKKENSELKKENSDLKKENSDLKEENSALKEENKTLKQKICEPRLPYYICKGKTPLAANVVWDPASAHYALILSDDGKKVKLGEKKASLLNAQKFDKWECVLATEGFSSGRHYWEVEVNREFIIGVTSQAAQWKGKFSFYPSKGFWCLCHYRQSFTALEELTKCLPNETLPRVLGVCIDVDEKWVTFHNTETKAHIYTFRPMSFADQKQIYPIFSTLVNQETTPSRSGKLPS
ncbi:hypothetical protein MHYP_G00347520 [Metynnis hypsauchen]